MKYVNAEIILPRDLLIEIQKYIQGDVIYIPKRKGKRKVWGENTGIRHVLDKRNDEIRYRFANGVTIEELSQQFFLSTHSIKKVVYPIK